MANSNLPISMLYGGLSVNKPPKNNVSFVVNVFDHLPEDGEMYVKL